jgi:type III secretion protein R
MNIFSESPRKVFAFAALLICFVVIGSSLAAISVNTTPPAGGSTLTPLQSQVTNFTSLSRPNMITQTVAISFMALMPFLVMLLTSFVKIVVVLSLLRNALGVQQAPPNQVINGVAFLLSIYVMYPTGVKMYDAAKTVVSRQSVPDTLLSADSAQYVLEVAAAAREPLRDFLRTNSLVKHHRINTIESFLEPSTACCLTTTSPT